MIREIIEDIEKTVRTGKLFVGFSGGEDSSLVAVLAKEALGRERVQLVTIDWGEYTYRRSRDIVKRFVEIHNLPHVFIEAHGQQKRVWRFGPSCNSCTKHVKIPLLKEIAGENLVATGANAYDTWGRTGVKLMNGVYAPLSGISKEGIRSMLVHLGIEIERIGESEDREGCKLKNLLKMLINEDYHGKAISISNEILLEVITKHRLKPKKASVKIIGPLSKNIAVIRVEPQLPPDVLKEVVERLSKLDVLDDVKTAEEVSRVIVVASPPVYRNEEARRNVEKIIDIPGEYEWIESKNEKLRTFQVVEVV